MTTAEVPTTPRWQTRVWGRFWSDTIDGLRELSDRYVAASRARSAIRIEAAPSRRAFPPELPVSRAGPPTGRIIFVHRTSDSGRVDILGRLYRVDADWPHRLVRAELDPDARRIRFHALRRREPSHQPLLAELEYELPSRRSWVTRTY